MVITKTCLYNFEPLKPHFYIVKLGFTGVSVIFPISAQKHTLWVLAEAVLTSTHNLCFEQKYEKYQSFLSENFQFLEVKFSIHLNRRVFVMKMGHTCHRISTCRRYSSSGYLSWDLKWCKIFEFLLGRRKWAVCSPANHTVIQRVSMKSKLRFHYKYKLIQIYRKFYLQKLKIFR